MAFIVNLFCFFFCTSRNAITEKLSGGFLSSLSLSWRVLTRPALPVERAQFPNGNDDISSNFVADAVCSRIEMLEGV